MIPIRKFVGTVVLFAALSACATTEVSRATDTTERRQVHAGHEMAMLPLGTGGWMILGMAQVFPTVTTSFPADDGTPLDHTELNATQPALMFNIESPSSNIVLHTTLNFEGITQPGGELTFGAWGEGFIDRRHPHAFLHEAMLSWNAWRAGDTGLSLSAGRGFASYGTDDPMMRPAVKYPINHHLSQILERWTVNGIWSNRAWSVEASLFAGDEPGDPWDFGNLDGFGDSWSVRARRRIGVPEMGTYPWEIGASFGLVEERHHDQPTTTKLYNVAIRHEHDHGEDHLYTLLEFSRAEPELEGGYYSVLGEASLTRGAHKPYGRVELATRPEFDRDGPPDTRGSFRYDRDDPAAGSSRWLTIAAGYGYTATDLPLSVRPYVEAKVHRVRPEPGAIDPVQLFGRSTFWSLAAGVRLFMGSDPMRMGAYGVLDPMTIMHRTRMEDGMEDGARDGDHH